jgi:hypothetical protein
MAHYSRRFFLQTLLTIPLVACSKKVGQSNVSKDSLLTHFNVPLPVETLDSGVKAECRRKAEAFYKVHSSQSDFNVNFEKLELEQFKNDQIIFLDGMAVSHIMTGFILMARGL